MPPKGKVPAKRLAAPKAAALALAAKPTRAPKPARLAKPASRKGALDEFPPEASRTVATCLDQKSGLFHSQHFWLSLNHEFKRMERTEKPLGLIVMKLSKAQDRDFYNLAAHLKMVLRPLDLAARLMGGEVAILIPEADRDRAARLVKSLGREYEPGGKLTGPSVLFGAAMARSFQGGTPDELVQKARDHLGPAPDVSKMVISGENPWIEVDTALAGAERDSLFNGFGSLSLVVGSGRRP